VPHECEKLSAPHRLRVCVLKKHSPESVYQEIARRADLDNAPWRRRDAY
jgi:hypothetical protein